MFFTIKICFLLEKCGVSFIYEEEKINYLSTYLSTFQIQCQEMANQLFFNDGLNYIKVHIFIYIAAVCLL